VITVAIAEAKIFWFTDQKTIKTRAYHSSGFFFFYY